MEVRWIPNKGQSEFDIEAEAGTLNEEISKHIEATTSKATSLDESINEFKQIAKDYLE
jgi:hypothetical protein